MARKIRHRGIESAARYSSQLFESRDFDSWRIESGGSILDSYYMLWRAFGGLWWFDTVSCQLPDPKGYYFAWLW